MRKFNSAILLGVVAIGLAAPLYAQEIKLVVASSLTPADTTVFFKDPGNKCNYMGNLSLNSGKGVKSTPLGQVGESVYAGASQTHSVEIITKACGTNREDVHLRLALPTLANPWPQVGDVVTVVPIK